MKKPQSASICLSRPTSDQLVAAGWTIYTRIGRQVYLVPPPARRDPVSVGDQPMSKSVIGP